MRPLQETPSLQQQQQYHSPTMPMHEPISSYKCFDEIATQNSISINFNRNLSNPLRSNSLDSLANSSDLDSLSDTERESSIAEIGPLLSDCDSINDIYVRDTRRKESSIFLNGNRNDLIEKQSFEISANDTTAPIVKDFVEKTYQKTCEQRICIDNENKTKSIEQNNVKGDSVSVCDINILTFSDNLGQHQQQKTRRTSIASSGSVSRMETIIEEPIEPKISVKEILARFETLTTLEVIIKLIVLFLLILFILFDFFALCIKYSIYILL